MLIRCAIIAAALLSSSAANAEWSGHVYDSGDIRQASLTGHSDDGSDYKIVLICSTAGDYARLLSLGVVLPATGKYSVRRGDLGKASVTVSDQTWTVPIVVAENGSSGFSASADDEMAMSVVQEMEAAPGDMAVSMVIGPIDVAFQVNADDLKSQASEWLDACGR